MAKNRWKLLEMDRNGRNGQIWKEMAGNGWNGLKWLDVAGHSWKGLELAGVGWNGWKRLEFDKNANYDAGESNRMALSQF